jgi:hypothetical protein
VNGRVGIELTAFFVFALHLRAALIKVVSIHTTIFVSLWASEV